MSEQQQSTEKTQTEKVLKGLVGDFFFKKERTYKYVLEERTYKYVLVGYEGYELLSKHAIAAVGSNWISLRLLRCTDMEIVCMDLWLPDQLSRADLLGYMYDCHLLEYLSHEG